MTERLMILSSDGHAVGKMEGYRDYLESRYHDDFDDFLRLWNEYGTSAVDEKATKFRVDDVVAEQWAADFLDTGRAGGRRRCLGLGGGHRVTPLWLGRLRSGDGDRAGRTDEPG